MHYTLFDYESISIEMKCEQANMAKKIICSYDCVGQKNNSFTCVELHIIVH